MSAPTRASENPVPSPATQVPTAPGATARTPTDHDIRDAAARIAAAGQSARRRGLYPVNRPMVDHWATALSGGNPPEDALTDRDQGEWAAPPSMIQVWTMPGLRAKWGSDDPLSSMMTLLDEAGFTSVVATNCEQTYHRPLREGEEVSVSARLDTVTGPKRTALGEGWFVTTLNTWFVADEPVAEMLFRVLKFRPPQPVAQEPAVGQEQSAEPARTQAPVGPPLRPVVSRDTEFFWAGTAVEELRVQRCEDCGALRHPPGPRCTACGSTRRGYQLAAGTGTVFSYVVHHHPPVSGRRAPFLVALIELTEGVRMLGELVGADPHDPVSAGVAIGAPVRISWQRVDDELTLPAWRLQPSDPEPAGE